MLATFLIDTAVMSCLYYSSHAGSVETFGFVWHIKFTRGIFDMPVCSLPAPLDRLSIIDAEYHIQKAVAFALVLTKMKKPERLTTPAINSFVFII